MKRYLCAVLAAALLAPALLSVGARAQDDGASSESAQSEHPAMDGGGMSRMKRRLDLSDEQSAKFQDAAKAHGEAMKRQAGQAKDALKKLAEDVKAKAADDALLSDLAALKAARKSMAEENGKFEEKLAAILTPTQRAKLAVGMAMRQRHGRGRGDHGHGGEDRSDDGQ